MFLNTAIMNIWHPGRFLPRSNKIHLARDGVTEVEGPGCVDDRPFIVTLLDPFDLVGLIKGRDRETAFWERGEGGEGEVEAEVNGEVEMQKQKQKPSNRNSCAV